MKYMDADGNIATITYNDFANDTVAFEVNGKVLIWPWADFIKQYPRMVFDDKLRKV